MEKLLAVDVGLRTGMALFRSDGRLEWYRSRKLGKAALLKRIAYSTLRDTPEVVWIVLEGGGPLATIWEKAADKLGIAVLHVCAETWRDRYFIPRKQSSGSVAKKSATALARKVIEWSGAPKPTSLRHDTAEAILVGFWGVQEIGWLDEPPAELVQP